MSLCFSCSQLTKHSRNIDKIEKGFHSLGLGRLYSGNCFPYYIKLAKSTLFVPVYCQLRYKGWVKHFLIS